MFIISQIIQPSTPQVKEEIKPQVIEAQEEIEKEEVRECKKPYNEKIGIRCCIPDLFDTDFCNDEAKEYFDRLHKAYEDIELLRSHERYKYLTRYGKVIHNEDFDFSFLTPGDYFIFYDVKKGGLTIPYRLQNSGTTYNRTIGKRTYYDIIIEIFSFEDTLAKQEGWGFDIEKEFENINDTEDETLKVIKALINYNKTQHRLSKTTTKQGIDSFIIESNCLEVFRDVCVLNPNKDFYVHTAISPEHYMKVAIFVDRAIIISYRSIIAHSYLNNDFDKILNSFILGS